MTEDYSPRNGRFVDKHGTVRWYKDDKLHREDGPAVIYSSGTKCWYQNNKWHREDGPAIIHADGEKHWIKNSQTCPRIEILWMSIVNNLDPREVWS